MNPVNKKYIYALLLFLPMWLGAQNISVQSFQQLPDDLDARVSHSKMDQNGDNCAIIKVVTTEQGFTFEGDMNGIVSTEQKIGEYWVYVPHGSKSITLRHPQLGLLRNYNYTVPIKEATVYELLLTTGKVVTTVVDYEIPTEWVVISSEPSGANIYIDDEYKGVTPYQQELEAGSHTYRVDYPLHHSSAGRFEVSEESGKVEMNLNLDLNYGSISVSSSPENGAKVLLDGAPTGRSTPCTLENISSENHRISLQHTWYEPVSQDVLVSDGEVARLTIPMNPTLKEQ